MAHFPPGTALGGFELLAHLGTGGQGTVYLARPWDDHALRRHLIGRWLRTGHQRGQLMANHAADWNLAAIKVAHPDAMAALHDEHSHLLGQATLHPHLTALYGRRYTSSLRDLGLAQVDGQTCLYLALVYETGMPLHLWLAHHPGPCSLAWAISLGLQVASALEHVHQCGLIHHDLRPANLMVRSTASGQPHVVLIDFGAVESIARPRRRALYGVPHLLPPERQGPHPGPATPHVDIYALGRLLQLLTAGHPLTPDLSALLSDATRPVLRERVAALPSMKDFRERLLAVRQ